MMIKQIQFEKDVGKELSSILRNIRFAYKNRVKLQMVNVKSIKELKLSVMQDNFPFNRWLFLIRVPKNYPSSPLWIEPIQISDDMRKNFKQDNFNCANIKVLVESVIDFCQKFHTKNSKSSKVTFPGPYNEIIKETFLRRNSSSGNRDRNKMNKMLGFSRRRALSRFMEKIDHPLNRSFKIIKKPKEFMSTSLTERKSILNWIKCLELKTHIQDTTEYVLFQDLHDLSSIGYKRGIMSSLAYCQQQKQPYKTADGDNIGDFDEFNLAEKLIQKPSTPRLLNFPDQCINHFTEECQSLLMEVIYSRNEKRDINPTHCDIIANRCAKHSTEQNPISSFSDVDVWPNYLWSKSGVSVLQSMKVLFPQLIGDEPDNISGNNQSDCTRDFVLKLTEDMLQFNEELDCSSKLDFIYDSHLEADYIRSNWSTEKNDLNNAIGECFMDKINCIDCLMGFQSLLRMYLQTESYLGKEFNKGLCQPPEFIQGDIENQVVYDDVKIDKTLEIMPDATFVTIPKSTQSPSTHSQVLLNASDIGKVTTKSKFDQIKEMCMRLVQPPSSMDRHLAREIIYTIDVNLRCQKELEILDYFNIPNEVIEWCSPFTFLVSKDKIDPNHLLYILILDRSEIGIKKGRDKLIKIHRIKPYSYLYNLFLEKSSFKSHIKSVNNYMFFNSSREKMFWPMKLFKKSFDIMKTMSHSRKLYKFILEYLMIEKIEVISCDFNQSILNILDELNVGLQSSSD